MVPFEAESEVFLVFYSVGDGRFEALDVFVELRGKEVSELCLFCRERFWQEETYVSEIFVQHFLCVRANRPSCTQVFTRCAAVVDSETFFLDFETNSQPAKPSLLEAVQGCADGITDLIFDSTLSIRCLMRLWSGYSSGG